MTSWTEIQIIYSWKADQIIFTRNGILVFVIYRHTIDAANNSFYISLTADRNATSLTQIVVSEELKIQKNDKNAES